MGFFKRRKKRQAELERIRQENTDISAEEMLEDDAGDQNKIKSYITNCCNQISEVSKELEEETSEYRIVSEYLKDIQTLENLPKEDLAEIYGTAESVQTLNRKRDAYQNTEKKISDAQFMQMEQEEDRIPDAIVRLKSNEDYQTAVKRDMNYLEGEKTEWHYNKYHLIRQQKLLKNLSFALLFVFAAGMAGLVFLQYNLHKNLKYAWMAAIFAAAVGGFFIFLKFTSNQTEIRRSEINMNHAIALLNKVKFKYVNVTNAVDYARDKYHVKNASEFKYLWEQYLNEVKEREKFRQANEDLEYFSDKLIRQLNRYHLYDARVWVNQSSALVDKKEMVEVKHNLIVRRQKLRSRIEINTQNIRDRKNEMEKILKKQHMYTPQVREIIDSLMKADV